MARCGSCGGQRRAERRSEPVESGDPSRAMFAAASPRFVVVRYSGDSSPGRSFATLAEAEAYARRTRGVIRTL